jgi:hypothetical protein
MSSKKAINKVKKLSFRKHKNNFKNNNFKKKINNKYLRVNEK